MRPPAFETAEPYEHRARAEREVVAACLSAVYSGADVREASALMDAFADGGVKLIVPATVLREWERTHA